MNSNPTLILSVLTPNLIQFGVSPTQTILSRYKSTLGLLLGGEGHGRGELGLALLADGVDELDVVKGGVEGGLGVGDEHRGRGIDVEVNLRGGGVEDVVDGDVVAVHWRKRKQTGVSAV